MSEDQHVISDDPYLRHYGILRKSGRYPWGSGKDPYQRGSSFLAIVAEMKANGMTPVEIARTFHHPPEYPFTTTDLRATTTIANNAKKAGDIARAEYLKTTKGMSNVAIGEAMGINESSVRALLAPGAKDRKDRLDNTVAMLKQAVAEKGPVDVGKGNEHHLLGVNQNSLNTALSVLKAEGYKVIPVQVSNLGSFGNKTIIKTLAPPGTEYKDLVKDVGQIKSLAAFTEDNGRSWSFIQPPVSVSSNRVAVNYREDGGSDADGVIYVRRGVSDLDMGGKNYAQVRIMVDNTHYLKGMAIYSDKMPPGKDLVFNTNKSKKASDLDAMKPLKRKMAEGDDPKKPDKFTGPIDLENPFGSIVRQLGPKDEAGRLIKATSALNLVNEEGDWGKWSKNLSAQMLSKQSHSLVKERLDESYAQRKEGLDEILALNNAAIKKKLLLSYADDLDAAAVHLKAAALPRQKTQVILPVNTLKENEVYAPNFTHGERVALVRYPHGGKFEIPELIVNNNHAPAKRLLGNADDAIGINSKVAARLSGADFDGDTVLVIPNNRGKIKSERPLKELEGFDPQARYPGYDGMPPLSPQRKQRLMGDVSNLITDMTIKGASNVEIAAAVRHSMVVIDAEKHNLNWRQSAIDNNIASLKKKYQGSAKSGASTLISQKKSPITVPERKLQKPSESSIDPATGRKISGPIDPVTGKKIYRETGAEYPDKKTGKMTPRTSTFKKLEYYEDANDPRINSGTPVERLYGDYSNSMKALANQTRLAALNTGSVPYSDSASRVYSKQVAQLNSKLNTALKNAPLERQAQVIANAKVSAIARSNPGMDKAERKKLEYMALSEARTQTGAKKVPIYIEDDEWEAIQAGALRPTKLSAVLDNSDLTRVKALATPRTKVAMTTAKQAKAQRLLATGATQAEIAEILGVSLSTLKRFLNGGG